MVLSYYSFIDIEQCELAWPLKAWINTVCVYTQNNSPAKSSQMQHKWYIFLFLKDKSF